MRLCLAIIDTSGELILKPIMRYGMVSRTDKIRNTMEYFFTVS
jgi:hypothetical protein